MYHFTIEQTLHFPEFVEWCAVNYSSSERIIVSRSTSRTLCQIDAKAIREILNLPNNYPDSRESVNKSVLTEVYRNCETDVRCKFLSNIFNEGQSLEGLFFPYHVHIFKEEVQLVVSLVC